MTRWLVITLAAPLASFGEEAGNVQRGSAERPTRSALLGLAGAALGILRADNEGQRALTEGVLTATHTIDPGVPVTDFHTYQSLPRAKGHATTRADALARSADLATSITRRTYRAGGLWQAAYMQTENAKLTLDALRAAFLQPRFALWLGRKSCPLSAPLAPQLIEAEDVTDAFRRQGETHALTRNRRPGTIAIDERIVALGASRPTNASRRERRNDDPGNRLRWQFGARTEQVYPMPASGAEQDTTP